MIGALRGTIVYKDGSELVIETGGVGYQVTAAVSVLERAAEIGSELEMVIHTDVKETSISLFAFDSYPEREVFLLLKKVKGVGSKLALTILSSIGSEQLLSSIGQSDVSALQKVSGVGKKTAERIIVELREQVGLIADTPASGADALFSDGSEQQSSGVELDAVMALERLGFARDRAKQAVARTVQQTSPPPDAGELVRAALANL